MKLILKFISHSSSVQNLYIRAVLLPGIIPNPSGVVAHFLNPMSNLSYSNRQVKLITVVVFLQLEFLE